LSFLGVAFFFGRFFGLPGLALLGVNFFCASVGNVPGVATLRALRSLGTFPIFAGLCVLLGNICKSYKLIHDKKNND
jgi:hypothetical protein